MYQKLVWPNYNISQTKICVKFSGPISLPKRYLLVKSVARNFPSIFRQGTVTHHQSAPGWVEGFWSFGYHKSLTRNSAWFVIWSAWPGCFHPIFHRAIGWNLGNFWFKPGFIGRVPSAENLKIWKLLWTDENHCLAPHLLPRDFIILLMRHFGACHGGSSSYKSALQ